MSLRSQCLRMPGKPAVSSVVPYLCKALGIPQLPHMTPCRPSQIRMIIEDTVSHGCGDGLKSLKFCTGGWTGCSRQRSSNACAR